ncbi:MAG TPA: tripartite tricarboxylate transporter substrate binding protein [Thermodesulfobacteriota bacterium]|nr:tripartite tricarboxylate transporter substrate binding protein [Thermodesulfobacteriota bacterium]
MTVKLLVTTISSVLFLAMPVAFSEAQVDFPTKPIQIVIGQPPGGSTDILIRALAQDAKNYLKQDIVPVNKAGAAGTVGAMQVAAAKPDGYTLGGNPTAAFTIGPYLQDLGVDLVKETTPILSFAKFYGGVFVKSDSPFKTLKDLLEFAKKNPGKLTYGHPGVGTRSHLIMEMIAAHEGIKMNFVAFAGDAPEVAAILGGHVLAGGASAGTIWTSQIQAGALKFLAAEERMYMFPEIPTLGELGYPFSLPIVLFVFGPKNIPGPVVSRLADAFGKAAESPAFKDLAKANTVYAEKNIYRDELAKFLQTEKARTGEFIQKVGLGKK